MYTIGEPEKYKKCPHCGSKKTVSDDATRQLGFTGDTWVKCAECGELYDP